MQQVLQKILSTDSYLNLSTGYIDFQPSDLQSTFIHCTFSDQTEDKIKKFYPGQSVYVADLDLNELEKHGFQLKVESNPGGQTLYPHVYHVTGLNRRLPVSSIIKLTNF